MRVTDAQALTESVVVSKQFLGTGWIGRHLAATASAGDRLVPDTIVGGGALTVGTDGEIRLTYAQLTELIDEAVRQLAHRP